MKENLWYFAIFFVFMRDAVSQLIVSEEILKPDEILHSKYEYGNLFEGDMDLYDEKLAEISDERNVQREHKYKWPNAIVPYVFPGNYSLNQEQMVLEAMKTIEVVSCASFKPRSNGTDHVQFEVSFSRFFQFVFKLIILFLRTENTTCRSNVGHRGGKQHVNLKNHGNSTTGMISI